MQINYNGTIGCPKFKVHALLLRSSAGGTQKYEYMKWNLMKNSRGQKFGSGTNFFSFRLYMWCALKTFTGRFMQRVSICSICPFFITSAVFCGLLGISFWAKSWWMVIRFCWPLSLDGLTSLLPCDMVKMHHVIFTMTWYIQQQSSPNCCCMSCLLFVCFF